MERALVKLLGIATAIQLLAVVVITACGADEGDESQPSSTQTAISVETAPPNPNSILTPSPTQVVPHSRGFISEPVHLDERIIDSEIIVVASFVSATAGVETISRTPPKYLPVQVLQFRADEYLKGTGPVQLMVEVPLFPSGNKLRSSYWREDRDTAQSDSVGLLAERNTAWDDRPGILFLTGPVTPIASSGGITGAYTDAYNMTHVKWLEQGSFQYTIDTSSRAWLPASEAGGDGNRGASEHNNFIEDAQSNPPMIVTKGDIQTRINEIQAIYDAGDGSAEYKKCVDIMVRHPIVYADWTPDQFIDRTHTSGLAAGARVYRRESPDNSGYREGRTFYYTGDDAELFEVEIFDSDNDLSNGYFFHFNIVRPLPAGEYSAHIHSELASHRPCNFRKTENDGGYSVLNLTATAPAGTLHEAFFDPVEGGEDEVSPASFSVGGTDTEITGWNGRTGRWSCRLTLTLPLTGTRWTS